MTDLREILSAMLDKARRKLAAAERAYDAGDWDDSSSRAYYAAFHAVSAVLRARNLVYSSHAQTLGAFNRECVLTGAFPREFTQSLTRLFEDRQLADYEVLHGLDRDSAQRNLDDARRIVSACAAFLQEPGAAQS